MSSRFSTKKTMGGRGYGKKTHKIIGGESNCPSDMQFNFNDKNDKNHTSPKCLRDLETEDLSDSQWKAIRYKVNDIEKIQRDKILHKKAQEKCVEYRKNDSPIVFNAKDGNTGKGTDKGTGKDKGPPGKGKGPPSKGKGKGNVQSDPVKKVEYDISPKLTPQKINGIWECIAQKPSLSTIPEEFWKLSDVDYGLTGFNLKRYKWMKILEKTYQDIDINPSQPTKDLFKSIKEQFSKNIREHEVPAELKRKEDERRMNLTKIDKINISLKEPDITEEKKNKLEEEKTKLRTRGEQLNKQPDSRDPTELYKKELKDWSIPELELEIKVNLSKSNKPIKPPKTSKTDSTPSVKKTDDLLDEKYGPVPDIYTPESTRIELELPREVVKECKNHPEHDAVFIKKNSISDSTEISSPVQWLGNKDPEGNTLISAKQQIVSKENTLRPQDFSNKRKCGVYCLSDKDIETMNCGHKIPPGMKVGETPVTKACSFKSPPRAGPRPLAAGPEAHLGHPKSKKGGKRTKKRKI